MSTSISSLGSAASSRPNSYTAHQHHIQQILAVTSASISVLFALLTFYSFMRVKILLFRHHLIIVLIASDLFKALWYFVPPVVIFAQNRSTGHALCQASGFLLAVGIEASDFIILLMAIHTALSVLRPRKPMGLHSYRYVAYACWVGCFTLLASLAFIDRSDAYISQGTFCYLPARPIWYRLALSWVPRYMILAVIVAIYLTIYTYTKLEFEKLDINLTSSTISEKTSSDPSSSPTSPDRSSHSRRWFGQPSKQRRSTSAERSVPAPSSDPDTVVGQQAPTDQSSDPLLRKQTLLEALAPAHSSDPDPSVGQQAPTDQSPDPLRRKRTLLKALRDKSFLPVKNRQPQDTNHTLRKRHKAIKRQLRYMFVYPLVYAVMWVVPFINHCYLYTKEHNPPFALNCISLVSLSLQCAVDCLVFGIREKPWRLGVEKNTRRKGKQSTRKSSDVEMVALAGGTEGPASPGHSVVVEGQTPRAERNWWDNEPM